MKTTIAIMTAVVLGAVSLASAQTPTRMPDQDLKQQIEKAQKGLERFIDGMDSKIRTAILKGDQGEIDVKVVLNDLKESASRMKDRFNPPSANAVTEAVAFLKKTRTFDSGLALRPGLSGADMKWADLRPDLVRLAGAYGIDWNADAGSWISFRFSDEEVKSAAQTARKGSEELAKQVANLLKKDKTVDAGAKAKAGSTISALTVAAKSLEDALKNRADPTAAVTRVLGAGADVATFMDGNAAVERARPFWASTSSALGTIAKAYGVSR